MFENRTRVASIPNWTGDPVAAMKLSNPLKMKALALGLA